MAGPAEPFDWSKMLDIAYFLENYYWETVYACVVLVVAILVVPFFYFLVVEVMKPKAFLNPTRFQKIILAEREELTHNTRRYRFALPKPEMRLGLPIGQHIQFRYLNEDGSEVLRKYTPTSDDDLRGFVDFVIKVYPKGKMSQHVDQLKIGDALEVKGPEGKFKSYFPNCRRAFGMIAGGTGITPMYQIAKAIVKNPEDKTKVHLIFANVTADDILLKEEWDALARDHPDQVSVYYVLNEAPEGWKGGVGFVTADMIKEHCPPPAEDITMLRCGPYPMNKAVLGHLTELGYQASQMFVF